MLKKIVLALATGVAAVLGVGAGLALPWLGIGALAGALALWLTFSRAGRRVGSITASGMSTLPQRWGSASVVVLGIAGVVGELVSLLAMGQGYESTFSATGSDDTAIVLQTNGQSEIASSLDPQSVMLIGEKPQVARSAKVSRSHRPKWSRRTGGDVGHDRDRAARARRGRWRRPCRVAAVPSLHRLDFGPESRRGGV